MPLVMLVDDDVNQLKSLLREFRNYPEYKVVSFDNAADALADARKNDYDIVVSDMRMPKIDGVSFLSQIKVKQPLAARIILSGFCDKEALYEAINVAQADRYLEKPCSVDCLRKVIDELMLERKLQTSSLLNQKE